VLKGSEESKIITI